MNDVYKAPAATLTESSPTDTYGSVESAVLGDYQFTISDALSEGWAKTKGAKTQILVGVLIYIGVSLVLGNGLSFLIKAVFGSEGIGAVLDVVATIISTIIILPIGAGMFMLGIKRSVDQPISGGDVLNYFDKIIPLAVGMIIMYLMLIVGFICLILPGIYLAIGYIMAMPLIVEKNMGPWEALETSRKAISKKWFSFFGFYLLAILIVLIAAIPLGIGLIWAGPWLLISCGVIYRNMFGVAPQA